MLHLIGVHALKLLKQVAACCLLLPRFLLSALMLWLLDFLCIRKKVLTAMRAQSHGPDDPPVCVSDSNRMFTVESLKAVWHGQKLDFFKSAYLGSGAPNTEVIGLDGVKKSRILDYAMEERPLVLNFGSCTWPPFMARLQAFNRLAAQHVDIADFLLIYIEEAHPSDGWVSTDTAYQIPKHQCLQDRLKAAQLMTQGLPGCPVVVDTMDNDSNAAYGAYFERLYIIQEGKVTYQGGRGPEGYKICELRNWLNQYRNQCHSPSSVTIQL